MLLPRIRCREIFLGVAILTVTTIAQAVSVSKVQVENKLSPAPVMQSGSRLFAGDPKQNEFYILGADEANPIRKDLKKARDKNPAFINTHPLQAGLDTDGIIDAQSADPIIHASNLLSEESDASRGILSETPEHVSKQASDVTVDSKKLPKEKPPQVEDKSSLSKVKAILHNLTRKMADKKAHSKARLAGKSRGVSRSHVASNAKQKKVTSKLSALKVKRVWHLVAEKHAGKKLQRQNDIAVLKVRYIDQG